METGEREINERGERGKDWETESYDTASNEQLF